MTKKHFIEMAARFKAINYANTGSQRDDGYRVGLRNAIEHFCDVAIECNPRFDRAKFLTACGF